MSKGSDNDFPMNSLPLTYNENLIKSKADYNYKGAFLNGIKKAYIKPFETKSGEEFFATGIKVPGDVSKDGYALVTFKDFNIVKTKNDDYINLRYPADYNIKVRLYDKNGNKSYMKMKAEDLERLHNSVLNGKKEESITMLNSIVIDATKGCDNDMMYKFEYDDHSDDISDKALKEYLTNLGFNRNVDILQACLYARVPKEICDEKFNNRVGSDYQGKNYVFELGSLQEFYEDGQNFNNHLPLKDDFGQYIDRFRSITDTVGAELGNHYRFDLYRARYDETITISDNRCSNYEDYHIPASIIEPPLTMNFDDEDAALDVMCNSLGNAARVCQDRNDGFNYFLVRDTELKRFTLCCSKDKIYEPEDDTAEGIVIVDGHVERDDSGNPDIVVGDDIDTSSVKPIIEESLDWWRVRVREREVGGYGNGFDSPQPAARVIPQVMTNDNGGSEYDYE